MCWCVPMLSGRLFGNRESELPDGQQKTVTQFGGREKRKATKCTRGSHGGLSGILHTGPAMLAVAVAMLM